MRVFIVSILLLLTVMIFPASAQDSTDMLKGLANGPERRYVTSAFKSSRVINGHSMEFIGKGGNWMCDPAPVRLCKRRRLYLIRFGRSIYAVRI
jgi:hypothetical protein